MLNIGDLFQGNNWLDQRWRSNNWVRLNIAIEPGVERINISAIASGIEVEL
jgi:hypothetical protein